jgi:hypothetical protein
MQISYYPWFIRHKVFTITLLQGLFNTQPTNTEHEQSLNFYLRRPPPEGLVDGRPILGGLEPPGGLAIGGLTVGGRLLGGGLTPGGLYPGGLYPGR